MAQLFNFSFPVHEKCEKCQKPKIEFEYFCTCEIKESSNERTNGNVPKINQARKETLTQFEEKGMILFDRDKYILELTLRFLYDKELLP